MRTPPGNVKEGTIHPDLFNIRLALEVQLKNGQWVNIHTTGISHDVKDDVATIENVSIRNAFSIMLSHMAKRTETADERVKKTLEAQRYIPNKAGD